MTPRKPTAYLAVHAKPKAKNSQIVGFAGGVLSVALAAPPVDGAANDALLALLAEVLGVPRRDIELARGTSSRHKRVALFTLTESELLAKLAPFVGP